MQTINLKLKDGSTHELNFPDGMTDQQIQFAIHKEYGMPKSNKIDTSSLLPENATSIGQRIAPNIIAGLGEGIQNIANVPRRTAELAEKYGSKNSLATKMGIKSSDIPASSVDFAKLLKLPNTSEDQLIRGAAQFLPALVAPEANLAKIGSVVQKIPKVGNLLSKMLSNIVPVSAYSATQAENPAEGAAAGAAGAAPFSALGAVASSANPTLRLLARLGLAGGLGYGAHEAASTLSPGSPLINDAIAMGAAGAGLLGKRPATAAREKVFEGIKPEDVKQKLEASRRLGLTYGTPAEMSGSPFAAANQGTLGKTSEGSRLLNSRQKERLSSEKKSINDFYNTIFDKKSESEVDQLYEKSKLDKVPEEKLVKLRDNEIFKQAEKDMLKSAAYREKLKGIPKNSIGYLHQIKQAMDDMIQGAPNKEGMHIIDAKNDLLEKMDEISESYAQARPLAERQIVRRKLEEKLNDKDERGTNFYTKFLRNDKQFDELLHSLRNVPEAQEKAKDMRLVFGDLINPPTVRTAAGYTRHGMDQERSSGKILIDFIKHKFSNEKYDKAAIELITNPNWDKELEKIMQIKDKPSKAGQLFNLLGRISGSIAGK